MSEYVIFLEPARPGMPSAPTDEEARLVGEHFQYLKRLTDEGVVMLAGRSLDEDSRGIVIFDAPDDAAARALMERDPAVAARVFKAKVAPFGLALLNFPPRPRE
jgi:uncharacterized protein YciI